jgi:hypothetical protein
MNGEEDLRRWHSEACRSAELFRKERDEARARVKVLEEEATKLQEGVAKQALAHFEVQERISKKYGLGPGQLQSQWRDGKRTDTRELEDAICDALAMGSIAAWPGDGVGCAAQIVIGYSKTVARERDEARAELADAQSCLDQAEIAGGFTENGNLWRFWSNKAREYIAKSDEGRRKAVAEAEARGFERGVREAAKVLENGWPAGAEAILALLEPVTLQKPEA